MAGLRGDDGSFLSTTTMIRAGELGSAGFRSGQPPGNTTLVCLMTDAPLTKVGCGIVAKMAHAGMARAVDPVHSAADGDVVFALATGTAAEIDPMVAGVIAGSDRRGDPGRDRRATGVAGILALSDVILEVVLLVLFAAWPCGASWPCGSRICPGASSSRGGASPTGHRWRLALQRFDLAGALGIVTRAGSACQSVTASLLEVSFTQRARRRPP